MISKFTMMTRRIKIYLLREWIPKANLRLSKSRLFCVKFLKDVRKIFFRWWEKFWNNTFVLYGDDVRLPVKKKMISSSHVFIFFKQKESSFIWLKIFMKYEKGNQRFVIRFYSNQLFNEWDNYESYSAYSMIFSKLKLFL